MSEDGRPHPARPAENWGRRDSIRAGAVSGPWRSTPRAAERARPPEDPPATVPPGPTRPVAGAPSAARRPAAPRRRGPPAVVRAAAVGVVAAVAMVAGAVMVRPPADPAPAVAPAPEAANPEAANPEAANPEAAAPEAAAPEPPAARPWAAAGDPALAAVSGVRVRFGPGFAAARQEAIVGALAAAGVEGVTVEPLGFEVATSRVGYYRAEDRAAAEALARLLTPAVGRGEIGARDYAGLAPEPPPGRLDLWLGD